MLTALLVLPIAYASPEPCVDVDIATAVLDARDAIFEGRQGAASEGIAAAIGGLACLDQFATAPDLAALYQAGGVIAFGVGDEATGEERLRTALRIARHEPFDRAFPLDIAERFDGYGVEADRAARGTVEARSEVRVDGYALSAGASREVAEGAHLVQYLDATGAVVTDWLEVGAGEVQGVGPVAPAVGPLPRSAGASGVAFKRGLTWSGAGLSAAGAGTAAVFFLRKEAVLSDLAAADAASRVDLAAQYQSARTGYAVALVGTAAGLVVLSHGLARPSAAPAQVVPQITLDTVGVGVRVGSPLPVGR